MSSNNVVLDPFSRVELAFQILFEPSAPSSVSLEARIIQLQDQLTQIESQNNQLTTQVTQLESGLQTAQDNVTSLTDSLNAWTSAFPGKTPQDIVNEIAASIENAITDQLTSDNNVLSPAITQHTGNYKALSSNFGFIGTDISTVLSELQVFSQNLDNALGSDLIAFNETISLFGAFNNGFTAFKNDYTTLLAFWALLTSGTPSHWSELQIAWAIVYPTLGQLPPLPTFINTGTTTPPNPTDITALNNTITNAVTPRANTLPNSIAYAGSVPVGSLPNDVSPTGTIATNQSNIQQYIKQLQALMLNAIPPSSVTT